MERDEQTDHERLADELERKADDLEGPGEAADAFVKDARQDWEAKKSDTQVPGAMEDPRKEDGAEAPVPGLSKEERIEQADDYEDDAEEEPPRSDDQAEAGQ